MIHSTRAITLVLISAGSVLAGYHAFDQVATNYQNYADEGDWTNYPTSRSSNSSYYHGHHYYHSSGYAGSGWAGSSGSRYSGGSGMHGTSHGGFGGTGHASS